MFVSRKYLDTKYLFSFFLGNDETHRDSYTLENNYGPFPRVTDLINFAVIFLFLFPGSQPYFLDLVIMLENQYQIIFPRRVFETSTVRTVFLRPVFFLSVK